VRKGYGLDGLLGLVKKERRNKNSAELSRKDKKEGPAGSGGKPEQGILIWLKKKKKVKPREVLCKGNTRADRRKKGVRKATRCMP